MPRSTTKPTIFSQAPGRINIIGEHTDYNEGCVLPAAIGHCSRVRLQLNGSDTIVNLRDLKSGEQHSFDLRKFSPSEKGWPNYLMGVVSELQKLGASLSGFDVEFEGTVPIGSGMSSSAALECSLAVGLNELFGLALGKWELVKAAQKAEHHFVGTRCGIMDQFASIFGKKGQAMLLNCRTLEFEYLPIELGNYGFLLLNTNVKHSLSISGYNQRKAECEEAVQILMKSGFQIQGLRDVDPGQLGEIEKLLPERLFRRCRHVIGENQRTLESARALKNSELNTVGRLMYQSHYSLQDDYEVSCPELDFLVEKTAGMDFVLGSRMMGGGFGGCTLNLVETARIPELLETVSPAYFQKFGIDLTPIEVEIGDGARLVE